MLSSSMRDLRGLDVIGSVVDDVVVVAVSVFFRSRADEPLGAPVPTDGAPAAADADAESLGLELIVRVAEPARPFA